MARWGSQSPRPNVANNATLGWGTLENVGSQDGPRQPTGCQRYGSLSAVGVGLARAFERDLILRDFAAFVDGWSLGSGIGLRLRGRMRGLVDIDRVRTVDRSDHSGLLKDTIGSEAVNFNFAA